MKLFPLEMFAYVFVLYRNYSSYVICHIWTFFFFQKARQNTSKITNKKSQMGIQNRDWIKFCVSLQLLTQLHFFHIKFSAESLPQ